MKYHHYLLWILLSFSGSLLRAQEAPTPLTPPAASEEANRVELNKKVGAILQAYNQEDYAQALKLTEEADVLSPKNPDLHNLRGAIFVKQKQWDQAAAEFKAATEINPKHFPSRFNRGEVPFLQKKYAEARAVFNPLYEEDTKNELLRYKIFLTYLLEGKMDEAESWLKKFDFIGNSPAYYFAQAAWCFHFKKEQEANSYIASSISIFPPESNNLFAETLVDLGWLKPATPRANP